MKRTLSRFLVMLVPVLLLSACQQQTVRDTPPTGEATGQLGSPLYGPSPADVYINLSGAYLRERNMTEAFKNAKKAVIVDPESSNAYYMQALVYQQLGEEQEARASFDRAIQIDPRNPVALNALGSFLCDQGQVKEADPYFRRALDNPLYPTPWLAYHNAGQCLERASDYQAAESNYRAALRANPRFAPSLLGMSRMSYESTNYLSARAYLQRYSEVAKHTAESLWLGFRTENQLGDQDQMASYSLKLKARFPDSKQAQYLKSIE